MFYRYLDLDSEALQSLEAALEMLKIGKHDKAHRLFEHALALSPQHPDILNNYGEFIENTHNDIINADQMYFKVVTLNYFFIYIMLH